MIDWPSLVIGGFIGGPIGALLSTWHAHYVKRPKLVCVGGGGTSGAFRTCSVSVGNPMGLLGVKISENKLLGFHLNRPRDVGLRIYREPAVGCTASIKEVGGEERSRQLIWRTTKPGEPWAREVDIDYRKPGELMLFAGDNVDADLFSIFEPTDFQSPSAPPKLPPPAARFRAPAKFKVTIYQDGQELYIFFVQMKRDADGRLHYNTPSGGGTF
jgi:hypothetical protein